MELGSKQNTIPAFLLAVSIYVAIVVSLIFHMANTQEWVQRFTSKKESFLDVVLVERPRQEPIQTRTPPKIPESKPTAPPLATPTQQKPTAPKEANVRDLFRGIDASKLAEPKPIPVPQAKTQSRIKPEKTQAEPLASSAAASKLVGSLIFESAAVESSATGVYNEYLGRITELLEGHWQQTIDTVSGAEASVRVTIDRQGKFTYAIAKPSFNTAFNAKLRDFLERMRSVSFPPYVEGEATSLNVTFKDLME